MFTCLRYLTQLFIKTLYKPIILNNSFTKGIPYSTKGKTLQPFLNERIKKPFCIYKTALAPKLV